MSETARHPIFTGTLILKILPLTILLAACAPNFSPNTYSSDAVQRASKVDSGVVVGVRKVLISVDSNVATATGAAAGGITGSQVADKTVSALSALGGAVLGGIAGNEVGHNIQDTFGYEYIVRKPNGDLLSVTQKDKKPLKIGEHVLLIQGSQARIVKDYTEPVDVDADLAAAPDKPQSPNEPKPDLGHKPEPITPAPTEATTTPAATEETTTATSTETTTPASETTTATPTTGTAETTSTTPALTSTTTATTASGATATQQPSTSSSSTMPQTTPATGDTSGTITPTSDTSTSSSNATGTASP